MTFSTTVDDRKILIYLEYKIFQILHNSTTVTSLRQLPLPPSKNIGIFFHEGSKVIGAKEKVI